MNAVHLEVFFSSKNCTQRWRRTVGYCGRALKKRGVSADPCSHISLCWTVSIERKGRTIPQMME